MKYPFTPTCTWCRWAFGVAVGSLLPLGGAMAAAPVELVAHEYSIVPVPEALAALGHEAGIAVEGWEEAPDRLQSQKGDRVTFLVSAQHEGAGRHWLVDLVANDLTPEEQAMPAWPTVTLYTSTGREHLFASERTAVAIHVVGPCIYEPGKSADAGRKAQDIWSGALLNATFLRGRMDYACLSILGLQQARQEPAMAVPLDFGPDVALKPFPDAAVARDRAVSERLGLSVEAERAYVGLGPALQNFFVLMVQTPGVRDIAKETLNLSWRDWWNLARGKANIHISFLFDGVEILNAQQWGLPVEAELYSLPFVVSLNGTPKLSCRMAVRAPMPPGQNAAGIVALAVGPPDKAEPYVMLRAVAARVATAEAEK